jgi:plastocyanin
MKRICGLCILVIFFLVATGCTQPAPSATTTTVATTVIPTEIATVNATPEPTADVNATIEANVTAPITETMAETTVIETPAPVQTAVVTAKIIHIRNNTFVPSATTVLPGTGITWVNDDNINHAVKASGANAGMFNSGDIAPGAQWGYTFGAKEGTFSFTDAKFPLMNGTIIIKTGKTLSDMNPVAIVTQA